MSYSTVDLLKFTPFVNWFIHQFTRLFIHLICFSSILISTSALIHLFNCSIVHCVELGRSVGDWVGGLDQCVGRLGVNRGQWVGQCVGRLVGWWVHWPMWVDCGQWVGQQFVGRWVGWWVHWPVWVDCGQWVGQQCVDRWVGWLVDQ